MKYVLNLGLNKLKKYSVNVTPHAEKQMKNHLAYLKFKLYNYQAAESLRDDYNQTLHRLVNLAGAMPLCDEPGLAKLKLRKIQFQKHNYVMLYRIDGYVATVVYIYHMLQDYENKIQS